MSDVRRPAVAGLFYPGRADILERTVRELLDAAPDSGPVPKALILPHAGYVYSGAVAASGYRRIERARGRIERVVLAGPAHRYPLRGIATHSARAFETPLGEIPLDRTAQDISGARVLNIAHRGEHSLEVHLPFLQVALGQFALLPLLVGDAAPDDVADVLDHVWGGDETLIVISSDLSHFEDSATARRLDAKTARASEALDVDAVGPHDACGCRPVAGLMRACERRGLGLSAVDLRTSGDTVGDPHRVVGYGTFVTV
jgi:AmmeMemoRadiSam system protein B